MEAKSRIGSRIAFACLTALMLLSGVATPVSAAQTRASQHPITLRTDGALPALVDPLRLEQVVTNLLENAVKYSPEGSPIEVELARPSSDMVQVAVRDHGFGIPPERRAEIFERYYRGHAGDHASGMGLGLYISRQIVELHGGEVLAEFPPDGGSRFLVRLPTAASAPALS